MAILTLNAGSSSLKFSLFRRSGSALHCTVRGAIRDLDGTPRFEAFRADGQSVEDGPLETANHEQAIGFLLQWLKQHRPELRLDAAGHRIVHGGSGFSVPVVLDDSVLETLRTFVPLAPLHMPHNLAAIEALRGMAPKLPQVACFDTAFHRTLPEVEQRYALPAEWYRRGVRHYGFHGLSYEYIASVMPQHLGDAAKGRVIVAHLGHGASLCAMIERRSVATTMGFTPLDGIPMATRPGALDPGIVPWMMREAGLSVAEVDDLLNHRSGLLGLSGISGDVRTLLADARPEAAGAIDYFIHHTARALGSLAAAMGGLDALVFTAGIGEHAATVREHICRQAAWLGIRLDAAANRANHIRISTADSPVSAWVIPTDEERIIATHTARLIEAQHA